MSEQKNIPTNIIVRMPNWIGDFVMALPILHDLREAYPQSTITAMLKHPLCELLRNDPNVNEIFCFTRPSGFMRRTENRNVIEKLKRGHYDLGILLTNSFSSAWWFFRGRVKRRLGFATNLRSLLLTDKVPPLPPFPKQHLVKTYKQLLTPLGITPSSTAPKLFLRKEDLEEARNELHLMGLPKNAKLIGINPGAAYGTAKCWLPERFRMLTKKIVSNPEHFVVFFGDEAHSPLIKEICRDIGPQVFNLAGHTSLGELTSFIGCCDVLLTNDSGPMHIADALGIPVVALFGSTDEELTGPYQKQGIIIHKHVPCSPCFKRHCPIDFKCMKQIETTEVYESILQLLER